MSTLTTRADAEQYVRDTLNVPADLDAMLRWADLMADLYRAAEQTWHVDLVDDDEFRAIVWANRTAATNDDRAALVRFAMAQHADSTYGFDAQDAREQHRRTWEQRRDQSETIAIPAHAWTAADYDCMLATAADADESLTWALWERESAALEDRAPLPYVSARDLFTVARA